VVDGDGRAVGDEFEGDALTDAGVGAGDERFTTAQQSRFLGHEREVGLSHGPMIPISDRPRVSAAAAAATFADPDSARLRRVVVAWFVLPEHGHDAVRLEDRCMHGPEVWESLAARDRPELG
jgi:hypothetical protein